MLFSVESNVWQKYGIRGCSVDYAVSSKMVQFKMD